jgi:hypothetical protein
MPCTVPKLRFAKQGTEIPDSGVRSSGVVELAVSRAVEETCPLVPVEHENSLFGVTRYPHEDPLGLIRRC